MKSKDIHKCFDRSEVRDFLAENIKFYIGELVVSQYKEKIAQLEQDLLKAENALAAKKLMDSLGWIEFDVSDYVEDYHYDTYIDFVGTKEEFDKLFD